MTPNYPERIIQFGTGRFSRAFVDYFVHQANEQGIFDGSVVCVQSTGGDRAEALNAQDGRFNVWLRGVADGEVVDQIEQVTSISRVLVANDQWDLVLACARDREIRTVASIVSEVGFVLDTDDRIDADPPKSFAGKLTGYLFERAKAFDFADDAGLIVLPCENIEDSGDKLRAMVLEMVDAWNLGATFSDWIESANLFCNTLVDRIVTGAPSADNMDISTSRLGYKDPMITVAEPYALWAIEGAADVNDRLPFVKAHPGINIEEDIAPYRERKLRLLNGGHTLTVPLGILLGNVTVLDNMQHPTTGPFIEALLREEIGPTLPVDASTVEPYIDEVLERWRNPFLDHKLTDIAWQSTSKMRFRIIPTIIGYYEQFNRTPEMIARGFAAYLLLTRPQHHLVDEHVSMVREAWRDVDEDDSDSIREGVRRVCSLTKLWDTDLAALDGFVDEVTASVGRLLQSPRPSR